MKRCSATQKISLTRVLNGQTMRTAMMSMRRLPGTQRDRTLVPPDDGGRAPEEIADRDHLRLTEMLLRAPTAEQRSWQQ
jgi:hypothetical protein